MFKYERFENVNLKPNSKEKFIQPLNKVPLVLGDQYNTNALNFVEHWKPMAINMQGVKLYNSVFEQCKDVKKTKHNLFKGWFR